MTKELHQYCPEVIGEWQNARLRDEYVVVFLALQFYHRWLGLALCRRPNDFIRDSIDPVSQKGWRKRCGSQLKTWPRTVKQDAELSLGQRLNGGRCWNREWLELISSIASIRPTWSVFVRDTVNAVTHRHTHTLTKNLANIHKNDEQGERIR